jgi:sec-independent protein translocase protein TatA
VGGVELLVLLTIVLLLFGAKKVPQLGRSLGKGIRELREGMAEAESDADDDAAEMQARKSREGERAFPSEAAHSVASDAQGDDTPTTTGQKP